MLSSFATLIIHCCLIIGKESDKQWEEEVIMKKESKKEQKGIRYYLKRQKNDRINI